MPRVQMLLSSVSMAVQKVRKTACPRKTRACLGREVQCSFARAAVDAGADVVTGHGLHVLRAAELYKGKLIAYSLGNFCGYRAFSVRSIYSRTSAILDIVIDEVGNFMRKLVPLRLDQQAIRVSLEKHAFSQVSELGRRIFPDTYVSVGVDGTLQVQSTY